MSSSKATAPTVHGGYPSNPLGSGGSYGFSGNTGAAPANISGGYTYTLGQGLGVNGTSAADLGKLNTITISAAPSHAIMQWGSMADGNMDVTFTEEENGVWVKAVLATAYDLTPKESLAINLLVTGISILSATGSISRANIRPISYIRKHNLERHFNISLV